MKYLSGIKVLFLSLILSFIVGLNGANAQNYPEPQNPPRLVNDFAGILSESQIASLEKKLTMFNDTTSTQIAIVSVKSLDGMAASQYATELAHKWGIGMKGKDNGVLILVKPKYEREKGAVYIAVGYGLEGAIPDAKANRVVNNIIIPNFAHGDMFTGLDKATDAIIAMSTGEYKADNINKDSPGASWPFFFFLLFPFIFFIITSLLSRGRTISGSTDEQTASASMIIPWIIMNSGRHRGGFGGGSGFGGGGGGFGGFGGGGFGGGGAGGSW